MKGSFLKGKAKFISLALVASMLLGNTVFGDPISIVLKGIDGKLYSYNFADINLFTNAKLKKNFADNVTSGFTKAGGAFIVDNGPDGNGKPQAYAIDDKHPITTAVLAPPVQNVVPDFTVTVDPTGNVATETYVPPTTSAAIQITGVTIDNKAPTVGDTLTATVTPAASASFITYQWTVGSTIVAQNTSNTYKVLADDAGKAISVSATATFGSGYEGTVKSTATAPVISGAVPLAAVAVNTVQPVNGSSQSAATPNISSTANYTLSSISWSPSSATFGPSTVYQATIVLKAKAGYKFTDATTKTVTFGTISGGTVAGGDVAQNTYQFTVIFPATQAPVTPPQQVLSVTDVQLTNTIVAQGEVFTATVNGHYLDSSVSVKILKLDNSGHLVAVEAGPGGCTIMPGLGSSSAMPFTITPDTALTPGTYTVAAYAGSNQQGTTKTLTVADRTVFHRYVGYTITLSHVFDYTPATRSTSDFTMTIVDVTPIGGKTLAGNVSTTVGGGNSDALAQRTGKSDYIAVLNGKLNISDLTTSAITATP